MPTLELEVRRASFAPSTWNAEARTVEAVISTGADVDRRDAKGPYIERLDLSGIDPASLIGLPILRDHAQSVGSTVGVIAGARREGGDLVALIRFSAAADAQDTVTKVSEGVLRGVSIGYGLTNVRETTEAGRRVRTITPKIREASLTPIPADAASLIRSNPDMTTQAQTTAVPVTPAAVIAQPVTTETRAAVNAQIRALAEQAGLDRTWADAQIDAESDINTARATAFEAMTTRSAPAAGIRAHVGTSHEDPAAVVERRAEALACRMLGSAPSDAARPYMSLGLHDHARLALVRAGERTDGMGRDDMLTRSGRQGTSDFPLILDGAANKVIRHGYGISESPLKVLARPRSMNDLKPISVLELATASELENVTEHGEVKTVQLTESGESYRLATYAGIIGLTRAALINDDIGAFADVAKAAGQLAAEKEAKLLAAALTGSYKMRDGKALFHADHDNLAASGSALSIASLSAARQSLRNKTGLDGVTPANVTPKFLVVGAALETEAEQILATLNATSVENQNVFAGKLQLIVDARITGKQWFVVADPATAPVFELAYLGSAPGPQIEVMDGWRTLGREWRVLLDVGVGVVDTRGAYRNPGA